MSMQTHPNAMRSGAAAIAQGAQANPRELVAKLIEDNPTASIDVLFRKFRKMITDREDYQLAIDPYFFINAHTYLTTTRNVKRDPPGARAAEIAALKSTIVRRVLSLDFVMPNGKQLAECTFDEVRKLGREFAKLAKLGQAHELVGAVFKNERSLREALKS